MINDSKMHQLIPINRNWSKKFRTHSPPSWTAAPRQQRRPAGKHLSRKREAQDNKISGEEKLSLDIREVPNTNIKKTK